MISNWNECLLHAVSRTNPDPIKAKNLEKTASNRISFLETNKDERFLNYVSQV